MIHALSVIIGDNANTRSTYDTKWDCIDFDVWSWNLDIMKEILDIS